MSPAARGGHPAALPRLRFAAELVLVPMDAAWPVTGRGQSPWQVGQGATGSLGLHLSRASAWGVGSDQHGQQRVGAGAVHGHFRPRGAG